MPKFIDNFENHENLILRDHLALERTRLANERTLFAYLRTSLYLLTAGIGILEIKSIEHLRILAYLSIASSIFLFITGLMRYFQMKKHLRSYLKDNPPEK